MKSRAPVAVSITRAAAAAAVLMLALSPMPILAFFPTSTTTTTTTTTRTTVPFKPCLFCSSSPSFPKKALVKVNVASQETTSTSASPSSSSSRNFGKGNGKIQQALKKMRGSSVSISYSSSSSSTSSSTSSSNSSMEMEILSQELRKSAKVSSIFTNDLHALKEFAKEQQLAAGNFPGPCPIVYYNPNPATTFVLSGDNNDDDDDDDDGASKSISISIQSIIDNGASGIVLDVATMKSLFSDTDNDIDDDIDIDIICDVQSVNDIQEALSIGYNYAFLIHAVTNSKEEEDKEENDDDDDDNVMDNAKINEMLSVIPSDAVVLCSLEAMQTNNCEITRGKDILNLSISSPPSASTSTNSGGGSGSSFASSSFSLSSSSLAPPPLPSPATKSKKVHGLLIQNACVGDDEDVKYASFAVNSITKKSSSTFAMTGLTGSTNGHFGTMSDNATVETAKWKRKVLDN